MLFQWKAIATMTVAGVETKVHFDYGLAIADKQNWEEGFRHPIPCDLCENFRTPCVNVEGFALCQLVLEKITSIEPPVDEGEVRTMLLRHRKFKLRFCTCCFSNYFGNRKQLWGLSEGVLIDKGEIFVTMD